MRRQLPPLNALRSFEAAARLGRMTAAAEELAVTPGAVSRQVRQLELSLGVALFEGSKSKPQLSAAGRRLLPALAAALDQIEAAVRAVSEDGRGTLDVCCYSTFTVKWLIPRLYDFHAQHPDIEIRLSAADQSLAGDRERYDLAITLEDGPMLDAPGVLSLFPERLGPVLAPSLAASMVLRHPADLAGKPLLQTRGRRNAWQMWSESLGCPAPALAGPEFEHYYFTLEAAVAGLGISVAPWHLVLDDIRAGRLLAPLGFRESGSWYVAKRRAQPHARLDRLCDWLCQQARQMPVPGESAIG